MTRKDYVAIAEAIRGVEPADASALAMRDIVTSQIANVMAEDNPRFDRKRFLEAAGVRPPVRGRSTKTLTT